METVRPSLLFFLFLHFLDLPMVLEHVVLQESLVRKHTNLNKNLDMLNFLSLLYLSTVMYCLPSLWAPVTAKTSLDIYIRVCVCI